MFVSETNFFNYFVFFFCLSMCVFSVQHGKSYFLLLELESEALPARVALPADKKTRGFARR